MQVLPLLLPLLAQAPAPAAPPAKPQTPAPSSPPAKPEEKGKPDEKNPSAKPEEKKDEEPRGLRLKEPGAFDGYTIVEPLRSKDTHLVDIDGKVVHTWHSEYTPGAWVDLYDDGTLLHGGHLNPDTRVRFHGGGIGGVLEEISWDGKVLWHYELATDSLRMHHDLERLPNGNILVIAWEHHTKAEAVARGRDEDKTDEKEGFWPDDILELKPTRPVGAEIVWQWKAWDHLVQDRDPKKPGYAKLADAPGRIDVNADHRYEKKEETPEERKKRLDTEAEMNKLGYAGGDEEPPAKGAAKDAAPAAGKGPATEPAKDPANGPAKDKEGKPLPAGAGSGAGSLPTAGVTSRSPSAQGAPGAPVGPRNDGGGSPGGAPGGAAGGPPPPPEPNGDFMHMNAVAYLPGEDLILFSSPHLSEMYVIDHGTTTAEAATSSGGRRGRGGEILWRWGNPQNYGMGTGAEKHCFYQHDASFLPSGGEMHVLFFNNGMKRQPKEFSVVEEIALPFAGAKGFAREAGRAFGPSAAVWSYSDPEKFCSQFISGAQRLPNGDTLICEGKAGRVFEVTREGRIVWEYLNPLGGEVEPSAQGGKAPAHALFRAVRIPRDHTAVRGRLP